MPDTTNNNTQAPFDEEIDEDLLALSPPPPSPRFMLFTLAILVLSVVMLGWFVPELRFFLAQFSGAKNLGEAADIDVDNLTTHSFVTLDGFPLVQRTLSFKEGVKWFMMSDNTRKFFPIAGQPHLFVQWAESDAYKAYRDPENNPGVVGPPSHFKGHLMRREDLGKNYERVFVFYDCLKYHYLGRCNRCLGKNTIDECRDAFVCAEHNDKETCDTLLKRSKAGIEEELEQVKSAGSDTAKRQTLEQLRATKQEQIVSVRSVRLEELTDQASRLTEIAKEKKHPLLSALEKQRESLTALRIKALEIRAENALRTTNALGAEKLAKTRAEMAKLPGLRKAVEAHTDALKIMDIFIDIGDELDRLSKRCADIKKKAVLLPPKALSELAAFDPNSDKGTELNTAIGALESAIAEQERIRYSAVLEKTKAETAEKSDARADETSQPPSPPLPEVSAEKSANPDYQRLLSNLEVVARRAAAMVNKIRVLLPGRVPAFDKWAKKPDVLGVIPEGLREERVVGALGELEKMLKDAPLPEGADAPLLAEAYNSRIDQLNAAKAQIKTIESMPGTAEIRVVDQLNALEAAAPKAGTEDSMQQRIDALVTDMTSAGLYLINLKGAPEAMTKLDALLSPETLDAAAAELKQAESRLTVGDWVLVDGETPMDKLWVPAVYLMLLIMIFVNLRKLWRFYLAYKA